MKIKYIFIIFFSMIIVLLSTTIIQYSNALRVINNTNVLTSIDFLKVSENKIMYTKTGENSKKRKRLKPQRIKAIISQKSRRKIIKMTNEVKERKNRIN